MSKLPSAKELQAMYLDGVRVADLAAKYGVGVGLIYTRLYSLNTPMRRQGPPKKIASDPTSVEMKALYDAGLSQEEIGKRFGMTRQAVSFRLAGLEGRKPTRRAVKPALRRRGNGFGNPVWTPADIYSPEA